MSRFYGKLKYKIHSKSKESNTYAKKKINGGQLQGMTIYHSTPLFLKIKNKFSPST